MAETHELAVMCDTFHPLRLTTFARDLDDGRYAYSWYENAQDGQTHTVDEDPAGITSHLCGGSRSRPGRSCGPSSSTTCRR